MSLARLIIIGCSGKKDPRLLAGPLRARDAYLGAQFLAARDYVEAFGEKWVILSARYGFIWPDALIENYDCRMTPGANEVGCIGALDHMKQKQYGRLVSFERYICLAGQAYVDAARMILRKDIEAPLAGLGIGYRLQVLKSGAWDGLLPGELCRNMSGLNWGTAA